MFNVFRAFYQSQSPAVLTHILSGLLTQIHNKSGYCHHPTWQISLSFVSSWDQTTRTRQWQYRVVGGQFYKNHLVESLIENLKVHETTNNTLQNSNTSDCVQDVGEGAGTTNKVLCSICNKLRPGNRWCEQCCQYLCDYCEKIHNKDPDTKIHVIVDATSNADSSNLPQGAESDQVVNSRPCSKHPGKKNSNKEVLIYLSRL